MRLGIFGTIGAAAISLASFASGASANDFPNRAVTIVVPYTAGAAVDIAARTMGAKLATYWGQPVIIENRPGGGTTLGTRAVAQAQPDGHTLLFTTSETFTVVPHLAQHKAFKPMTELKPVNLLVVLTNALLVNPSLPVKTLAEFIAYAKANPNELSYSSPGAGSNIHLAMEVLKSLAKINIQHVPYRGLAPATSAVVANEVKVSMAGYSAMDFFKTGKLRMIVVAGSHRYGEFPDVPTTAELGYEKVDSSTLLSLAAPAKTPRDIIEKINDGVSRALNAPDIQKQMKSRGLEIANLALDAAQRELVRRNQVGAEMVRLAGADKE